MKKFIFWCFVFVLASAGAFGQVVYRDDFDSLADVAGWDQVGTRLDYTVDSGLLNITQATYGEIFGPEGWGISENQGFSRSIAQDGLWSVKAQMVLPESGPFISHQKFIVSVGSADRIEIGVYWNALASERWLRISNDPGVSYISSRGPFLDGVNEYTVTGGGGGLYRLFLNGEFVWQFAPSNSHQTDLAGISLLSENNPWFVGGSSFPDINDPSQWGYVVSFDSVEVSKVSPAAVPEPSTYAILIGSAVLCVVIVRRRRRAIA